MQLKNCWLVNFYREFKGNSKLKNFFSKFFTLAVLNLQAVKLSFLFGLFLQRFSISIFNCKMET